jgi:uncharacterized protein YbaP (TraB family)
MMEKHRYQITLDKKNAEEIKRILKSLGLPQSSFSAMMNDSLPSIIKMLKILEDRTKSEREYGFQELLSDSLTIFADAVGEKKKD